MNWQLSQNIIRKFIALVLAVVIWTLVHQSITVTKMFPRVSCRLINLPYDKTIRGLMPNGILDRKINLTLTGRKDVIDLLESQDFEVVIDVAARKGDEWVAQIGKKNLVSLNPDIDLIHNITGVSHAELFLKLSRLVTVKIPVYFTLPQGEPPEGYQFLDIVPEYVTHSLSGPEEDLTELAAKGLKVTFNLSAISKKTLDDIALHDENDEVSFDVPQDWMKVQIPFLGGIKVPINDPNAKNVKIVFLQNSLVALEYPLPLRVFYPISIRKTLNPATCKIIHPASIQEESGLYAITKSLYAGNVSKLFLDLVRDRMEIEIIMDDSSGRPLSWDVQFIAPDELENQYIANLLSPEIETEASEHDLSRLGQKEHYLRLRFRNYMKNIKLYRDPDATFSLMSRYKNDTILIEEF